MTTVETFREAMLAAGIGFAGELHADDRLHRFTVAGDQHGAKNGWYRLCLEPVPHGSFGCWKRGVSEQWSGANGRSLTDAERAALKAKAADEERRRIEEQANAAKQAEETSRTAGDAKPAHPYLVQKQVKPHGLKQYGEVLQIPLRDIHGKCWSLQSIYPNGDKFFLEGGRIRGCFYVVGELPDAKAKRGRFIICEGYATGASLHEATGLPVVCAMNAGNLAEVVKALRERLPAAELLLAADNDAHTPAGNVGVEKGTAAAVAVSAKLAVPDFAGCDQSTKPTDFNDLAALASLDEVRRQIDAAWGKQPECESNEAAFARLGALPPVDYDRVRQREADRLGIRVGTLDDLVARHRDSSGDAADTPGQGRAVRFDDPEPWGEPVNGAELFDEIAAIYRRFLILPPFAAEGLALWSAHTYCADALDFTPIVHVTAPERECGKSRVRDLAALLVWRPLSTDSSTPAFIFRIVALSRPTLFLDEFDNLDPEKKAELLAMLNGGFHKNGCVGRTVGEDHEPRTFSTFSPKMVIGIGALPDTSASRSLRIVMQRKLPSEKVASLRGFDGTELRSRIRRWVDDNRGRIASGRAGSLESLSDRMNEVWEPLLVLADAAGGEWPAKARLAAAALSVGQLGPSTNSGGELLLRNIREVYAQSGQPKLASVALCEGLNAIEESPWRTWGKGRDGLNANHLARLLGQYGIASGTIWLPTGKSAKGYCVEQFDNAFKRFAPSNSTRGEESAVSKRQGDNSPGTIGQDSLFQSVRSEAPDVSENATLTNAGAGSDALTLQKAHPSGQGKPEQEMADAKPKGREVIFV